MSPIDRALSGHASRVAGRVLWTVAIVAALAWVDGKLMAEVGPRSDEDRFRKGLERIEAHPDGVAIVLGNSTTGQWLNPRFLAGILRVDPREVTDATLSGCYSCCSWNVVQQLIADGRKYEYAFVGVNHYQMCEAVTRKRMHEQSYGLPIARLPHLFETHLHGKAPSRALARYLGVAASDVYADAFFAQKHYAKRLFGAPTKGKADRWYWPAGKPPPKRPKLEWRPLCAYGDVDTAMMARVLGDLLDDLGQVAQRTFLLVLPDREQAIGKGDVKERWARHRRLLEALARDRPHVTLIDLGRGRHVRPRYFRDAVHLTGAGYGIERAAFAKALRRNGLR